MRRLATVLGTLATAGIMALTLPATAFADEGAIIFAPGKVIKNPNGCYNAPDKPFFLNNNTSGLVMVFSGPDCSGAEIMELPPNSTSPLVFGSSVLAP
ncbi:hypothetical protein [Streptomyces sp. NPDC015350]|uniref:hypothetical protein n=1 Tax=Streptomyces sp. NPDC015350 TaxID=3364955 RepID=UPI0036FC830E